MTVFFILKIILILLVVYTWMIILYKLALYWIVSVFAMILKNYLVYFSKLNQFYDTFYWQ